MVCKHVWWISIYGTKKMVKGAGKVQGYMAGNFLPIAFYRQGGGAGKDQGETAGENFVSYRHTIRGHIYIDETLY